MCKQLPPDSQVAHHQQSQVRVRARPHLLRALSRIWLWIYRDDCQVSHSSNLTSYQCWTECATRAKMCSEAVIPIPYQGLPKRSQEKSQKKNRLMIYNFLSLYLSLYSSRIIINCQCVVSTALKCKNVRVCLDTYRIADVKNPVPL